MGEQSPEDIIAEGVRVAARHQRQRDVILGALLLVAGFTFGLIGVLLLAGAFDQAIELGFGGLGLGLSCIFAGAARLTRGLRG
jgi:hypothetical protein